ncbi:cell adhesion molecule CEACAM6-like [Lissotriton helveticus]
MAANSSKESFRVIKELLKTPEPLVIHEDPREKCSELATFFKTKMDNILASLPQSSEDASSGGSASPQSSVRTAELVSFGPVTVEEVLTVMSTMKSGSPKDPAPMKYLKQLPVFLGVCVQPSSTQGAAVEVTNAGVGQTVTLTAPVNVNLLTFAWYRGGMVADAQLIYNYFVSPPVQVNGPQYTDRETGRPDGSLVIRDLLTNYTGNYTVNVTPSGALPVAATRQLRVYELVPQPRVTSEPSQLVENRPAEITCNASKAATTILWSFNNSPDLPGNIHPSPDNRTLSIANVSREDSGIYQCVALNPINSSTSDPQTLTVAYGPEDVKIDPPGSQVLQVGDELSLNCTAGSFPSPQYNWFLNNTDLKRPGNTYTAAKVSSRDNGNYTCVAHNMDTGLFAKASVSITVNGTAGTDPSPVGSPGLSVVVIIGIAIAILMVVIIVCMLVYFFVIRKPASGAPAPENTTDVATTAEDIQYSSINFISKGSTQLNPIPAENTLYSVVRR